MTKLNAAAEAGTNGKAKGGPGPSDKRLFGTAEEARSAGRLEGCEKWRLWRVAAPDGKAIFLWSNGVGMSLARAAAAAGFTAACLDKPVNKDILAAGLAALSDEDRAILIRQFVPAPAAPPAQPEAKPSAPATKRGK